VIDHNILLGSGLVRICLAEVVRNRARGVRLDAHEGEAEMLHPAEGGAGRDVVGGRGRCLEVGSRLATRGLALAGLHLLLVLPLELRVLADGVGDTLGDVPRASKPDRDLADVVAAFRVADVVGFFAASSALVRRSIML